MTNSVIAKLIEKRVAAYRRKQMLRSSWEGDLEYSMIAAPSQQERAKRTEQAGWEALQAARRAWRRIAW